MNTENTSVRQVVTPIGEGTLVGWDKDNTRYLVRVSRKNSNIEIQSPCIFKFFNVNEIEEIE